MRPGRAGAQRRWGPQRWERLLGARPREERTAPAFEGGLGGKLHWGWGWGVEPLEAGLVCCGRVPDEGGRMRRCSLQGGRD